MQIRRMRLNRGSVNTKSEDKVEMKEEMIMIQQETERMPAILQSRKPVMVAFNPIAW